MLPPGQDIRRWNQGVSQAELSSGASGVESASRLLQLIDKIQLHEAIRLRSLPAVSQKPSLAPGGHPPSLPRGPLHLQASTACPIPLVL